MTFSTGNLTRCAGGNHYHVLVTIGQRSRTLMFTSEEIQNAPDREFDEVRDAIIQRLRSALIEADARTLAQARTAVENKTFGV